MSKYTVEIRLTGSISLEVEAETEEDARSIARRLARERMAWGGPDDYEFDSVYTYEEEE